MMLPYASNPKSPKRGRSYSQQARRKITPKAAVVGVFVVFNLGWFAYTLLPAAHSKKANYPRPHQPTNSQADAPGLYVPKHAAVQEREAEEGGLLKTRASAGLSQEQLISGSVEDLVVKGTLSSGDLKLSGHVLSSGAGKLLVSAGAVGIGTSTLDTEHDALVVNGPIRLTDAGARPRCDALKRGMIWHEFGDIGQGDSVDVCAKGRDEEYMWRAVVGAGGGATQQQTSQRQMPLAEGGLGSSGSGGLVRELRVAMGSEVQAGDVVTFVDGHVKRGVRAHLGEPTIFLPPTAAATVGSGVKRRTGLLSLGPNLCIIVHGGGTGSQAVAQVVKVHGTAVELRSKLSFGAKRGDHAELAALSDSSFVIAYADASQREVGYLVVGVLAGSELRSFSQPLAFEPSGCSSLSVAALSSSLVVMAFNGNAASGKGIPTVLPARVDDQKILPGNRTQMEGKLDGFVVVPLSLRRFVLVYRNLRTKGAAARLCRVESVQAQEGAADAADADVEDEELPDGPKELEQGFLGPEVPVPTPGRILTYLVAAKLSASLVAIAYADSGEGHVVLMDVSGDFLAPRPPVLFSSTKPLSLSLSALGQSAFLLTYYSNNPWQATAVKASVHHGEGVPVSLVNTVMATEYTSHTHSVALSPVLFLMTFFDGSNSDAGTAVAGTFGRGFGVAAAEAAEGEMVPVRFGGVSGDHMSLEVGGCYYSTEEGRLTTEATAQSVGLAISVNEILINGCTSTA